MNMILGLFLKLRRQSFLYSCILNIRPTVRWLLSLSVCLLLSMANTANAVPDFLERWSDYYPNSSSNNIECQLCHERASGGDGWNGYGWSIRGFIFDGFEFEDVLEIVEGNNSDFDELGLTNIVEIQNSMNPGWVNSNTNIIYFSDGGVTFDQPAPFMEVDPNIDIEPNVPLEVEDVCFPILTNTKTVSLICL